MVKVLDQNQYCCDSGGEEWPGVIFKHAAASLFSSWIRMRTRRSPSRIIFIFRRKHLFLDIPSQVVRPGHPRQIVSIRHLRHRQYLLLLDSFEHLLSGASLVSEIMHCAAQVTIVATSRERLNLHEETIVRIDGMAYPSADIAASFATDALDFSAVKLFVESARQVLPGYTPSAENLPHISHICRLLDGMPLGILLAAAWIELLSPAEITVEITRSLDFLQAEWRDVPERHLSMRAVFDSSWQRLKETQRELFARLAVFRGGFTRKAAKSVAGASLRDLASLVNKSLLRHDLGTGRYDMHELLRQYAREHLQKMPDNGESALEAHVIYFADLMQRQWLRLISAEQQMALAEIDADLENLRSSWRYWLKKQDAARIKMYIYVFWRVYDLRLSLIHI